MVSGLTTLWLLVALGQVPGAAADATWLKSVPSDVEIVARVRGLVAAHDDLAKMLDAMSPTLSAQVKPMLAQGLAQYTERYGKASSLAPLIVLFRLPRENAIGTPPYAFLVTSDDYPGVLKQLAGPQGNPKTKAEAGGFDSIRGSDGLPIFTLKGNGFVAFSNDEFLMKNIVRPKATLESALSESLRSRFFSGDAALYVNMAAVNVRYKDDIEQLRQQFAAGINNAPKDAPANVQNAAKSMYGAMFDALKDASVLVLGFDFSAEGLNLAGEVDAKPDSATAKLLTGPKTAPADELANLPDDLTNYVYFNASAASIEKLQSWGLASVLGQGEQPAPELQKALDLQREAGVRNMTSGSGLGPKGMKGVTLSIYSDPQKAVDATTAMIEASKSNKAPLAGVVKDLSITPKAEQYEGFVLNRATITWDLAKLAQFQPNVPNAANTMKNVLGESTTIWYGTDGKMVLNVIATDWEQAKAQLAAIKSGQASLGKTASFQALRPKLPAQVNGLLMMSAQGFVRQVATQLAGMMPDNPALRLQADMPKEPIFFGGAFITKPGGVEFQAYVPSSVGPVCEKYLIPLFQGIQPQPNK
jgi:hypothetical protein